MFLGEKNETRFSLVSPELHGRSYLPFWEILKLENIMENPLAELCTDHPLEAIRFFNEGLK